MMKSMTIHKKQNPYTKYTETKPYHEIDNVTNKITLNVSLKKKHDND